ncbi:hypothetical protein DPMN_002879 [Dreissena polymorpha]|uniref:Uncharacterized protein n=1 Tax=Dreissena polymorpha TaxID=45954 RepID=A0A9D4MM70_DREPO|nr:hypothetical protein DPMN_002879 [Dreissena polymorpha]
MSKQVLKVNTLLSGRLAIGSGQSLVTSSGQLDAHDGTVVDVGKDGGSPKNLCSDWSTQWK